MKIIKNVSNIRSENFEGDMKRKKIAKYDIINNVFYEWCTKCRQTGIYPDEVMLQEEAFTQTWGTLKHLMDSQNTSKNVLG